MYFLYAVGFVDTYPLHANQTKPTRQSSLLVFTSSHWYFGIVFIYCAYSIHQCSDLVSLCSFGKSVCNFIYQLEVVND